MKKLPSLARGLVGALAVLISTGAHAAFMTFNDASAFAAAVSGAAVVGTDGFDLLTDNAPLGHTLNRSAGSLSYQAFDPVGLNGLKAGTDPDGFLTNQDRTSSITLRTFALGVNAFGANFFGSELTQGFPVVGESINVYAEDLNGDWIQTVLTNTTRSTFFGFISDTDLNLVQFWTCGGGSNNTQCSSQWPSIDNLTLAAGAAVPVPVPEPMSISLVGLALTAAISVNRRRRQIQ